VEKVADTRIFARSSKDGRQFLVYSMKFTAGEDLAMILPIPVPQPTKEDAVRFINLEKYAKFFDDMQTGFPEPVADGPPSNSPPPGRAPLAVVEVGSFEASFVPAIKDFGRLDERFRLPAKVWDDLPAYKDSGFAVFKLKKGKGPQEAHPMAFEFPRAKPKQLFFPTVHIHDGQVHEKAGFDHALYCQLDDVRLLREWKESAQPAGMFLDKDKAQGLIDPEAHCFRRRMKGELKNEDTFV
jgi:hypothetical protein